MIKGKVTYNRPKGLSRKHIRAEVKESLREIGIDWHRRSLPKHFTETAAHKYRYQRRTVKHRREKLRRFGHQRPLVFTGALAQQVKRMARITPTSKGVRVIMKGPRYLYMRRKDQKQPDKARELTATTKGDIRDISRSLHARLRGRLNETAETLTYDI